MIEPFTFRDGERTIRFGRGAAAEAVELLGGAGYTLLTTERAAAAAPHLVDAAASVHHVGPGLVENLAGGLLEAMGEPDSGRLSPGPAAPGGPCDRLVALGGGRVVDVAKALAAGRAEGARALAVPTTLSGAEMTASHRHARGVDPATPRVRCAIVINDPALSASQPVTELAASALNALGHAVEAPCAAGANPVSTLAAREAARLLVGAFEGEPDRDALALGALLAGYAMDSTGFGIHHVLSQTLVRVASAGHAQANAAMLPGTIGALATRFPDRHEALATAIGADPATAVTRIAGLAGASRLRELGIPRERLAACADAAAARPDLGLTPPRADRAEVLALYERAW